MVKQLKLFSLIFLTMFLISGFAIAKETTGSDVGEIPEGETNPVNIGNENEQPYDILKEANKKLDENLQKEIQIPWGLEKPVRFIFGLKDSEDLSFQKMIVLISLAIIFILIVVPFVKLMPEIFGEGITVWAITIIIFLLGSASGVLNNLVDLMFHAVNLIDALGSSTLLKIILIIITLIAIYFGVKKLKKAFKKDERLSKAVEDGKILGENIAKEKVKTKVAEKFSRSAGI